MSIPSSAPAPESTDASWTAATRRFLERRLPLTHLLPSRQPFFVGSWVYVFGVVAITALVWVIGSGIVLAFFGYRWRQTHPSSRTE